MSSTTSTTDPYLLREDQRHARNLRPHTLHDHEHNHSQTQTQDGGDGGTSPSGSNRLNDFASHILESHDPHDHNQEHEHDHEHEHEHEHDHTHNHVLSFTGEGGVLESHVGVGTFETAVENVMANMSQAMGMGVGVDVGVGDQGDFQPHIETGHGTEQHQHGVHREAELGTDVTGTTAPRPVRKNNYTRGRKRKMGSVDDNGDPVDPILLKKENHKEVERKRRTNINEGIDLLVAQMNMPELEKQGKGVQLRRAVEYVAELDERVISYEKEAHELRKEKQDLEANLALTSQRYTEEHERCTRYETMWRDAQDREAKSQFDIAQLLDEIAQLRRRVGEAER